MHTIFIAREQPAVSDNMLHGARVGAAADDKRLAFLIARLTSVNLQNPSLGFSTIFFGSSKKR